MAQPNQSWRWDRTTRTVEPSGGRPARVVPERHQPLQRRRAVGTTQSPWRAKLAPWFLRREHRPTGLERPVDRRVGDPELSLPVATARSQAWPRYPAARS